MQDAGAIYQKVKQVLSPDAFRKFADAVRQLNERAIRTDDALARMRSLLGSSEHHLFESLETLLRQ